MELANSNELLNGRNREISEKLVELEHERELAGGQFIPSDRDYLYSIPTNIEPTNEILEEARNDERRKINGNNINTYYC